MPLFYALLLYSFGGVTWSADYPCSPFWAPRIEINRKVSIPFAFQKCEEMGRVENFLNANDKIKGLYRVEMSGKGVLHGPAS